MATKTNPLAPELLKKMDAYWRAANYLSVGQVYLYDNPLLKRPLSAGVEDSVEIGRGHVRQLLRVGKFSLCSLVCAESPG